MNPRRWILSVDLGQSADFTAIGVLERTPGPDVLRHVERCELGTPYPKIAKRVKEISENPALEGDVDVLLDATGVGRPVVDICRAEGIAHLVPILIVTGTHVSQDKWGYWHVPKKVLVGSTQVSMQNQALKLPANHPLSDTMVKELRNFKMKVTDAGNQQFEAWRSGDHDDLVLMLAQSQWWTRRLRRPVMASTLTPEQAEAVKIRTRIIVENRKSVRQEERRKRIAPWMR